MLVTANVMPVPRDVSIVDREWVRDLRAFGPPALHISRVRRRKGNNAGCDEAAVNALMSRPTIC